MKHCKLAIVVAALATITLISGHAMAGIPWLPIDDTDDRFELVMNDEAVLDNETGLIWQRSPGRDRDYFGGANSRCTTARTGDRWGWRLPTAPELATLLAPRSGFYFVGSPAIPTNTGFVDVHAGSSDYYWTQSFGLQKGYGNSAGRSLSARVITFSTAGSRSFSTKQALGSLPSWLTFDEATAYAWCVRGAGGGDSSD